MTIATSPVATSLRFAASSTPTTTSITAVKSVMPVRISLMMGVRDQSWMPENIMNAIDISPAVMNVMPRPRRPSGTSE